MIESYSFGQVVIEERGYSSDVLILPKGVKVWQRRQHHRVSPQDLSEALSDKPEVLVIGTGAYGMMQVLPETKQFLETQGVVAVISTTNEACNAYNQLCHSQRVAAALHLTC
jgi:hypothetical protein